MSTVQLLADDPIVVGAGRITAKVKVSPDLYDSDHSNDAGRGLARGRRAAAADRPVRARSPPPTSSRPPAPTSRPSPTASRSTCSPPGRSTRATRTCCTDCTSTIFHAPGLTDAGLMGAARAAGPPGPPEVDRADDRQGRRRHPARLVLAPGDARPRSRPSAPRRWAARSTPRSSSARTPAAGSSRTSSPTSWAGPRRPASTATTSTRCPRPASGPTSAATSPRRRCDFMHFSTAGADVRKTTDRWISKPTWDFLDDQARLARRWARPPRQGVAAAQQRTLSLTGTVKADGSVVAGDIAEVEGEPDAGEGEGPLTFEQLDARRRRPPDPPLRRSATTSARSAAMPPPATSTPSPPTPRSRCGSRPSPARARLRIRRGADVLLRARPPGRRADRRRHRPGGRRQGRARLGHDGHLERRRRRRRRADALRRALHGRRRARGSRSATRRRARSLTVKASLDLAGTDVRVRVTTTDGWNTTTDVSAPFSIGGQLSDGQIVFNDWGTRRRLDRRHRRRRRDEDRRPRPPPALVARRHQARLGLHRPLHGQAGRQRRPQGHDRQAPTRAPLWADEDTLLAKLENAYPQGNQLVETANGAATDFGSTSASKFGVLCDVSADGTKVLGRAGLYEDSWSTFTPAGDKAAELRAVKSCGSLSPDGTLRGRHEVPLRQRLADRRDRRRPQDRAPRPTSPTARSAATTPTRPGRRPASGSSGAPTRTAAARPASARPTCGGSARTAPARRRSSTARRSGNLRTSRRPTSSRRAAWRPTPSRRARSSGPSPTPAGGRSYSGAEGAAVDARRPRLQARRGRRRDRRLRVGPRRRRRLRRRRRRAAARRRSPTRAPTRSPSR